MNRRLFRLVPIAALVVAALAWSATPENDPLTEEDVVRLFAAGKPTQEILRTIEEREPGYELTPEMLEELRNVELPEILIETMKRRLAEKKAAQAQHLEETRAETSPVLTLHLNRDRGGGISVGIKAAVHPQLAAEWELGNAPEDRVFADLALFVGCLTSDHVPDQWRLKSTLGRDFHGARRHRLLELISGAGGEGQTTGGRNVRLVVPASLELALEPHVAHDLWLGLAVQVGGAYRVVVSDVRPGVMLDDAGVEIDARVRGGSVRRFKVAFGYGKGKDESSEDPDDPGGEQADEWDDESDDESEDAPAGDQPSSSETSVETPGSSMVTP